MLSIYGQVGHYICCICFKIARQNSFTIWRLTIFSQRFFRKYRIEPIFYLASSDIRSSQWLAWVPSKMLYSTHLSLYTPFSKQTRCTKKAKAKRRHNASQRGCTYPALQIQAQRKLRKKRGESKLNPIRLIKVATICKYQWLSMITNDYYWLPMAINDYEWLSMILNDY